MLTFLLALALLQDPEIVVTKDVAVALKDGTILATDVYLPAKGGPFPAIFARTPYDKATEQRNAQFFARHGYAYVAQDTRGRFGSTGTWRFIADDTADGAEAAAWLVAQPWSNGKFGMIGTSYVGGTQHAMALAKAPGLATVIPVDAVSNMGVQSMRNAGAFELRFWNWIMLYSLKGGHVSQEPGAKELLASMSENRRAFLAELPLRKGTTPLKLAPEYEDWLVEAMRHGADDAFWEANNILEHTDRYKDVPVWLVGGWYDSWAGNTTANYRALSKSIAGPVYLVMGPWIHGSQGSSAHGQVDFGKDAAIADPLAWRLAWYDRWLAGDNGAAIQPTAVRIFVMGKGDCSVDTDGRDRHGGAWRDEKEWPLARAKPTPFFLGTGGVLSAEKSSGSTSFVYDPHDPVPTIGGNISSGDGILLQGAWDQRGGPQVWNAMQPVPLSARNDVLVFQTAPLAEDVEVTGELEVKLWISSSAPDTDFTAKLVDVHPRGFDMNIADGILRCRFRDSLKAEKLMVPGQVYPITIRMYPTSNVFKKGHRIRVDVSSSNFPRFDLNPNTGEPLGDNRRWATAVNTVYHDAERPSQIVLPVVR